MIKGEGVKKMVISISRYQEILLHLILELGCKIFTKWIVPIPKFTLNDSSSWLQETPVYDVRFLVISFVIKMVGLATSIHFSFQCLRRQNGLKLYPVAYDLAIAEIICIYIPSL